MSELKEECYKCLNNQSCISGADYGSMYCMLHRKYKMQGDNEDSIYAIKFAAMQEQIKEKDKRIAELEEERELVGLPVRNKRSGTIGIVLHQWKNGSIAVLEKINPRVINTHDSWNTLEIITDKVNQNKVKEETKKWKLKRI